MPICKIVKCCFIHLISFRRPHLQPNQTTTTSTSISSSSSSPSSSTCFILSLSFVYSNLLSNPLHYIEHLSLIKPNRRITVRVCVCVCIQIRIYFLSFTSKKTCLFLNKKQPSYIEKKN